MILILLNRIVFPLKSAHPLFLHSFTSACYPCEEAYRETKKSVIDLTVGIVLHKKNGDFVVKGDSIATIYASDVDKQKTSTTMILDAYEIVK